MIFLKCFYKTFDFKCFFESLASYSLEYLKFNKLLVLITEILILEWEINYSYISLRF